MDEELYQSYQKIETEQDPEVYERLKEKYDCCCQIGGYPSVVRTISQTHDREECRSELVRITDTFMNESIRYFTDVLDTQVFTDIFLSVCRILEQRKERTGGGQYQ